MRVLVSIGLLLAACSQDEAGDVAHFRLAFWSVKTEAGGPEYVPIRGRATLKSGTYLGMLLEGVDACHIYVIYKGAGGEVHVLYPKPEQSAQLAGVHWVLDDAETRLIAETGIESFYVIAAREPLADLEKEIQELRATGAEGTVTRGASSAGLMETVDTLRARYGKVTADAVKPAVIGGTARGTGPQATALEYAVTDVRCLTFTVDHCK